MHFEARSRFRKGWMISIQKKQKVNEYFDKKIRGLVNWCHEQDINWTQYTLNWLKTDFFLTAGYKALLTVQGIALLFQNFGEAQNIDCSHTFISFDYFFSISLSCNIWILIMGILKKTDKSETLERNSCFFF